MGQRWRCLRSCRVIWVGRSGGVGSRALVDRGVLEELDVVEVCDECLFHACALCFGKIGMGRNVRGSWMAEASCCIVEKGTGSKQVMRTTAVAFDEKFRGLLDGMNKQPRWSSQRKHASQQTGGF